MKTLWNVALMCTLSGTAFANETDTDLNVLETESGKELTLEYFELEGSEYVSVETVSRTVKAAELCGAGAELLNEFVLWMPGHGHGSAPTTITIDDTTNCALIENIRFTMPGFWELRLKFKDDDTGLVKLDI